MIRRRSLREKRPLGTRNAPLWVPPRRVEYLYYFAVAYSIWAAAIGIELPLVAAGLTIALAGHCISSLGSLAKEVYRPIAFLIACIVSFMLIETVIHGTPLTTSIIRQFIVWVSGLIVVQTLCLRARFMHRYIILLFVLGLIAVPYLTFGGLPNEVSRARIGIEVSGNLSHQNGLANWFGFCTTYFAIYGLESKRHVPRTISWLLAIGCLLIVGYTVSRGALLATAIATSFGFRRILGRGFAPMMLLILIIAVAFESGVFQDIILRYEERSTVETGRLLLWPHVIERFLTSPFFGVGVLNRETFIPEINQSISTPHNTFLFFALSAGILPLAFYIAYWIRAARSYFSNVKREEFAPFQIPFLLYVLVTFMVGDVNMAPWVWVALTVGAGAAVSYRRERSFLPERNRLTKSTTRLPRKIPPRSDPECLM